MLFFSLPTEIMGYILSYLSEDELVHLFDLQNLGAKDNPYLKVQHMALQAQLSKTDLILSNKQESGPINKTLTIRQIEYLIEHQIVIKPKEFSFHLAYTDDHHDNARHMSRLLQYLHYLKICTENINIFLDLRNIRMVDDECVELLAPLFMNFNVNCFSLKYNPGYGKDSSESTRGMVSLNQFSMNYLKIHLLNSNSLLLHMTSNNGCFFCNRLEILDLSFNAINDAILSNIRFPTSLKCLSLSNNNIHEISELQFVFQHLTHLESLDLSNNNIIALDFDHRLDDLRLRSLNVSGNLICDMRFLKSPFCSSLIEIDASRNAISHLVKFPKSVRLANLRGNSLAQPINFNNFPYQLERLDLSSCGIDFGWNQTTSNLFIHTLAMSLPYIDVVELDGNKLNLDFDVPIRNI